ncbi:hypothetical protein OB03_11510 [Brevundimonas sp. GN22]
MAIYPVIMCGGAGTRLWPASRPSRPKQFLPLLGRRSLFQDTVARVQNLVTDGRQVIVVAGASHEALVRQQLAEIGVTAQIILEPAGRDSAPAMAAAALWTLSQEKNGINIFVSSDHFLPDHDAFSRAALEASLAADKGKIVTLGVKPTSPSSAYGYIEPASSGLSDIKRFVEKPSVTNAQEFLRQGLLWNTGIFVARSDFLIEELDAHQPEICVHVGAAIQEESGQICVRLSDRFLNAPKISIDYAVMEKTSFAAVLPVSFEWSDMGAWDAVAARRAPTSSLRHILKDAHGSTIYSENDRLVSVLGVENIAVVVEDDAVLVCALDKAQDVKLVVDHVREISPSHLDFSKDYLRNVSDAYQDYIHWIEQHALPVWGTLGLKEEGIFAEELTYNASIVDCDLRLRVQARQCYVYCKAGLMGWRGPWRNLVTSGIERLEHFRCEGTGHFQSLLAPSLRPAGGKASVYDIAFVVFALASAYRAGIEAERNAMLALDLLAEVSARAASNGAIVEDGDHPYQSNVHMHLLEASLEWEALVEDARWVEFTDRIVRLAVDVFIDPDDGAIREFFTADWARTRSDYGKRVEPGHQFEWAWLLSQYAERRNSSVVAATASKLYEVGSAGIWDDAGVMADAMDPTGAITEYRARLWPQTEWARAALRFANLTNGSVRERYLRDAERALTAMNKYLLPNGLWQDQLVTPYEFAPTNAKASSLYHLMGVYSELKAFLDVGRPD